MERIGIIFGGRSGEHQVSLLSAASVIKNIKKENREIIKIGITRQGKWLLYNGPEDKIPDGSWERLAELDYMQDPDTYGITILGTGGRSLGDLVDFVLPIVHGPYCEDGKLQGLLEMIGVPYGGCHVLPSAVAMDKLLAKEVFIRAGLPVCKHVAVFAEELTGMTNGAVRETEGSGVAEAETDAVCLRVETQLGYPVYVKPANLGSSVGIHRAANREELKIAMADAIRYDRRLIIEEEIICREIETGIMGNFDPQAAVTGEIVATEDFYDYDAKYKDDGRPKMAIPADIPPEISEQIRDYAVRAYKAIDGAGYARVDFFLEKTTGRILLNEINTIPGFTAFSMFPLLWEEAGVPYSETIERVIRFGYERYKIENSDASAGPRR